MRDAIRVFRKRLPRLMRENALLSPHRTRPAALAAGTGLRPGDRDGLGQFDIAFQLDGADSPVFLAQFRWKSP